MKEGGEPHWLGRTQMLDFVNTEAPRKQILPLSWVCVNKSLTPIIKILEFHV